MRYPLLFAYTPTQKEKATYSTYQTWRGWEIVGVFKSGKKIYLASVYKGKCNFVTDYTFAKNYSERTAKKLVNKLNERSIA